MNKKDYEIMTNADLDRSLEDRLDTLYNSYKINPDYENKKAYYIMCVDKYKELCTNYDTNQIIMYNTLTIKFCLDKHCVSLRIDN
jgi:hypothetical protein